MDIRKWTQSMRASEVSVEAFMAAIESILISVIGRVGLWLTPLPSAFLVSRSASRVFDLTGAWPVIMAAIVELVGLACSHLWLTAREWNANKNKTDPEANERLAFGLMLAYFIVTGCLLLAFELPVVFSTGSVVGLTALLFPALSAVAVVALNERSQQHKRASDKLSVKLSKSQGVKPVSSTTNFDTLQLARQAKRRERLEALADFYDQNPHANVTDAAKAVGVSRQTLYTYRAELEQAGRIDGNGNDLRPANER